MESNEAREPEERIENGKTAYPPTSVELRSGGSNGLTANLEGAVDIDVVSDLRKYIFKSIRDARVQELTVDCSAVFRMDTAGVALLVELWRQIQARHGIFRLEGVPRAVKKVLQLSHLDAVLLGAGEKPAEEKTAESVTEATGLISVHGLNSFYRGRQVLFDIRFQIPGRRVTVIMGISGCGKTTLLRHLIGLKPTEPGQIAVEEKDFGRSSESELRAYRRRIGVLFQSGALFNSLTVRENIAVPLKVHTSLADETIDIMTLIKLHLVGLADFRDFMPAQLSGGMRKRAGLARALAMDPEILFVDEPSSGLDPITAAGLDNLILELRKTLGMTIVVVTHELESAFGIGDQLIVMDGGRILAAGSPEEIRESRNERVRQFLGRAADERRTDAAEYMASLLGSGKHASRTAGGRA